MRPRSVGTNAAMVAFPSEAPSAAPSLMGVQDTVWKATLAVPGYTELNRPGFPFSVDVSAY